MEKKKKSIQQGFSLVELLVGAAVFAVIAIGIYQAYSSLVSLVEASRTKITATDLINEQFELIRNLPYADVGLVNGIPAGALLPTETLTRGERIFELTRTIRNIDDPFDGVIGGAPNDLSPADYKLVELELDCPNCKNFVPLSVVSRVAPKNLESASTNGALFIQVLDANGQPLPNADVRIENNLVSPLVIINDVTNNQGILQVVDAPPAANAYKITVSKSGYTTDGTYATSTGNPNPAKPHATVSVQQVTQITFIIDKVSNISVSAVSQSCAQAPNISFSMKGAKLIGTDPDVLKFDQNFTTDSFGQASISNVEWDNYNFAILNLDQTLAGVNPLLPVSILPDSSQKIVFILAPYNPSHLLVTVKDNLSGLPLSGASVTLTDGLSYSQTYTTGIGSLRQTDWSGGGGQTDFTDPTRYFSSNGNIETANPAGELKLSSVLGNYSESGNLISSTFDTGTSSNFGNISWLPTDQPPESGAGAVRFQFATAALNTATTTWSYLGPDGTAASFYDISDTNIATVHDSDRFFRYKVFLTTVSTTFTPNVSDAALTFTSECIPPGQALFSGLSAGEYTLTVEKSGYAIQQVSITINTGSEQQQEVSLLSL